MNVFYKGAVIIGAVVVAGGLLAQRPVAPGADVPLLKTPAWQGAAPQYGEQLLLRRDTQAEGGLMLKHSNRDAAYRYDSRARNLTLATPQEWSRAGGAITECGQQFPPPAQVLRVDEQSHKLMAGQREVPTAGGTVLTATISPGHRLVAVLSAAGKMTPSLLPALGAGGASGPHYHQIVSLPDAVVIGKTVRIPVQRDTDVLGICWSAGDAQIVYYDILFGYLSVVDTGI